MAKCWTVTRCESKEKVRNTLSFTRYLILCRLLLVDSINYLYLYLYCTYNEIGLQLFCNWGRQISLLLYLPVVQNWSMSTLTLSGRIWVKKASNNIKYYQRLMYLDLWPELPKKKHIFWRGYGVTPFFDRVSGVLFKWREI